MKREAKSQGKFDRNNFENTKLLQTTTTKGFQNVDEDWRLEEPGENVAITSTHNRPDGHSPDDNIGSVWLLPPQDKADRSQPRLISRWSHVVSIVYLWRPLRTRLSLLHDWWIPAMLQTRGIPFSLILIRLWNWLSPKKLFQMIVLKTMIIVF